MFDFGLFEIVIVVIVGLIFIKPEDLPAVVKTTSNVFKKVKGYVFHAKDEINKVIDDIEIQEFNNNILENEKKYIEQIKNDFTDNNIVIKRYRYTRYYYDK